jgi:GDPmannose 4,6-dehydratase
LKTAIITGVTGQDGSYLTELLLSKGYKVVGLKRRTSLINTDRVDSFYDNSNFILEYWDLNDTGSLYRIIGKHKPNEIYNLAAQSHVRVSFDIPEHTVDGVAMGTLRILEAIRNLDKDIKFYQASSSEMYGDAPCPKTGYTEKSRMTPASPYACAKLFSHNLVRNYRESYGLQASSGILFNHESPRRGETFVTRKITLAAARIKLGLQTKLYLGNLNAKRDWGFAGDYVEAMWLMLQTDNADDYVIATGRTNTVREFLHHVFEYAGLGDYNRYVEIDPKYLRPHEVPHLLGNSAKAKKQLGWQPQVSFERLAQTMYESDLKEIRKNV